MRAGILKTLWVIIKSSCITASVCGVCVMRGIFGTVSRTWCDINMRKWSARLLKQAQVDYHIFNPHQVSCSPNVPYIMMCNHTSLYDIPLGLLSLPVSIRMLAKKELSRVPLVGGAMAKAEFPFIDRHKRSQAIKDLANAKRIMQSGIVIWLFPEGTRSKTGKLIKFKKGGFITAIQANAQIIPVGIRGADKILPTKSLNINFGQHAEIHIGEPVDASLYGLEGKEELVAEVERRIRQLSGQ